jgi:hypothetical protein
VLFTVLGPDEDGGREPLRGVEVWLDGVRIGTTDERGWFLASPAERPQRAELRRAGCVLRWGDVDPDSGALEASESMPYWCFLERAP